jgi:hypothetical protein
MAISSIALLDWQSSAHKGSSSRMIAPPPQVYLVLPVNSRFKGPTRALLGGTPEEFLRGHTFEVEGLGRPTLYVDGSSYALTHMYTRTPSEHVLDGKKYDMEVNNSVIILIYMYIYIYICHHTRCLCSKMCNHISFRCAYVHAHMRGRAHTQTHTHTHG